jgi:hypothetical protein
MKRANIIRHDSPLPSSTSSSPALVEGEDYYIERGMVVFTARYHLKRGSCCGSGCRHCPYDKDTEARTAGNSYDERAAR